MGVIKWEKNYSLATNDFLEKGGDGYSVFKKGEEMIEMWKYFSQNCMGKTFDYLGIYSINFQEQNHM